MSRLPREYYYGLLLQNIAHGLSVLHKLNYYLELGISRGNTFNAIAPLVKTAAYAVDTNLTCLNNIQRNKNLVWHNKTTDQFFKDCRDVLFDLIFIDADHHAENSMRDFLNSFRQLRYGGLIILHDTHPPGRWWLSAGKCCDSWKTAFQIKNTMLSECECCTLPIYWGMTVVRKVLNSNQLDWLQKNK